MIVWLGQSDNLATLGGKAAQLSRLFDKYPIPPGFCLPVAAFEAWWQADCPDTLPVAWQNQVASAYQQLATITKTAQPAVAVRSSAVDEDGHQASFAGQYETHLNVIGEAALYQAIVACWRSAFSERVQTYRQGTMAPVAVLVQHMLAADVAMVAFSRNPINQQAEIVINATWGLGQSLVDGSVTPDTYLVRPDENTTILQRSLGSKETMTIRLAEGVKQVPTPRPMRTLFALSEEQTQAVARLATQLEQDMGWPVDIEAAYFHHVLYLLQCRPITTKQ